MSKRRHRIRVFLNEPGRIELATVLTPWLRVGATFGAYVECRKVDDSGAYFEMLLDLQPDDDESVDVRLRVPHHFVSGVLDVSDFDAFSALYSA
ncbi:hypothetical protein [Cognatilysobacter lacus]|uniref:Uncharacterized protein n=1 Tax=Cognatilysobacter lacus TaxID=1643323 RepID=A0A5D8ZA71_9GAMM|nr:hypothetical protein [Lysobacter lacus]TZF91701.1 hypothetical protein FW784_00590 [Lysobacter lacus]